MAGFACDLGRGGWVLRSGAAHGADSAFEAGAILAGSDKEVYLPEQGFNRNQSPLFLDGESFARAAVIAQSHHPRWKTLSPYARLLHARNVYQVLGRDLATPSRFLLCWTEDGCECKAERTAETGGTGMAIELAEAYGVPVFNLARPDRVRMVIELVEILT